MPVLPFRGVHPRIDPTAVVFDGAYVIGDVEIGAESSIWFGTVVRGDVNRVRIGRRTNIQDNCVLHVTRETNPCLVGDEVTVGHMAILHGCTVKDRSLVGMGSIVLDRAVIGPMAFVGAGSLVTEGTVIPTGKLALGRPAKVIRDLTADEMAFFEKSAANYVGDAAAYVGRPAT